MNEKLRDFLIEMNNLKEKYPELRIGQIIWNALGLFGRIRAPDGNVIFYIEDDDLLDLIRRYSRT